MRLLNRRALLLTAASASATVASVSWLGGTRALAEQDRLAALEAEAGGRLGVAALDTANGRVAGHRAEERFPFCSTFKMMLASAILKRSETEAGLLQRRIPYSKGDLATYSPVTGKHAGNGMTVADLCAAAIEYSDNTAANLLIRLLGGPGSVTTFARSIGDETFRQDRWEPELNTAIPGDPRDTTTPVAMMRDLHRLALGDLLGASQREKLVEWMKACQTGDKRIRAGVPARWAVADKTGTGDYGTTNDVAVIWPPGKPPIVLVVYFTQRDRDARARDGVVASATRIVVETLGHTSVG